MAQTVIDFWLLCGVALKLLQASAGASLGYAGELETIIGYEAHAMSTTDVRVKKVLYHIADEERQNVGELQQMRYIISPKDGEQTQKGIQSIQQQQQQNFQTPLQ